MKYKYIALGGTFDILHKGHKKFILHAFKLSEQVFIGITTDYFNKNRGKNTFENQETRKNNLRIFLKEKKLLKKAKIIWLNDIFGNTLNNPELQAIVVTSDTIAPTQIINKKRREKHLNPLDIIKVKLVKDKKDKAISSSGIKEGIISPEGYYYQDLVLKIAGYKLSEEIREKLKKPFGKMVDSIRGTTNIIAVGDITVQKMLKLGIIPKLSIVDFLVKRKKVFNNLFEIGFEKSDPDFIVENIPGQISKRLVLSVEKALKKDQQIILVDGEEDLAVIPTVLLSPLGTKVYYGQPNQGLVEVLVTPESKNNLCKILSGIS